ncbi:MAG: CDP-alcohol phosphatidyltransferase family protein [Candidatus Binataceae bacterium]
MAGAEPQPSREPSSITAGALPLRDLLNVPNLLSLARLFSIPIFLTLLNNNQYRLALYVFAAAAMTDGLDGAFARWFDSKTELGAFLDPFADKLLLVSAFVVLTIRGDVPGWLLSVVLVRDAVITVGYLMLSFFTAERIPIRPSYLGKAGTFLQLGCVIAALMTMVTLAPVFWQGLLYLTLAVTALSGLHYTYRGLAILSTREPEMFE